MPAIRNTKQTKSGDKRKSFVVSKRQPRRPIANAERVAKRAIRAQRDTAINETIVRLWEMIMEFTEEKAPELKATADEIIRRFLDLGRKKMQTRRPNTWNAFQHSQAVKRKSALATRKKSERNENQMETSTEAIPKPSEEVENDAPPSNHEDEDPNENQFPLDLAGPSSEDLEDLPMGEDENLEPTLREAVQSSKRAYNEGGFRAPEEVEVLKKKLEVHRAEKDGVVKRQALAHQADVRKTLDQIERDVHNLGRRCEMEIICISVRTNVEHRALPRIIGTKGAKDYFQKVFKQEPVKFAFQMENHFTNGLYGNLARNANQRQANLKAEIRKLLTEGLAEVTDQEGIQFPWTDFFTKATEALMVEIRGWPLRYFTNPSYFKTKDDLEAVRNALLTGSCHFARVSKERLDELKIQHARAKEQGRGGEVSVLQEEDDARSVGRNANPGVARSAMAPSLTTAGADPEPFQSQLDMPQPMETYENVFQIDTYGSTAFQVDFSTASNFGSVPPDLSSAFGAPHLPSTDQPRSAAPPIAQLSIPSQPNPELTTPLAEPMSVTLGRGREDHEKRRRWDAGLDRNVAQEVKRLAEEADLTPAKYLAQHPEMYEKARENKHEKVAKKKRARVATAGSQA